MNPCLSQGCDERVFESPLGHAHYSGLLRDELGLSPSAEVRELERDLWPSAPN
ncbi:MAG TPA: hypothetical protein VNP92_21720 [Actinophytocola sp.]|nr:hypothetical protein [Actinophytocola sp.]